MDQETTSRFRLVLAFMLYGACVAVASALVYQNTLRNELVTLSNNGAVRLGEAVSRFRLQVDGYRALVNVIADSPQLSRALAEDSFETASGALANYAATYGAWRIDMTDQTGALLASSASVAPDVTFSPSLIQAALNNRLGFSRQLEGETRLVRLSRGIEGPGQGTVGVVVVSVSLSDLEFEWPVSPEPIVFFDPQERSFSANRLDLLLLSRADGVVDRPLNLRRTSTVGTIGMWRFSPPNGAPAEVIKSEQYVPQLDLTGVIFLDTSGARATAELRAILTIAFGIVLGLIGTIALQQRRRRLLEQEYSSQLEARVAGRTEELRSAQDALVEASKLAALGRLSAGVSHELNQPLGAILNFAENGHKFLSRGRSDAAAQNLTLISDQVRRITRIISNLRAFARQESAPVDEVDFVGAVRAVLEIAADDLAAADVHVDADLPDAPVMVLAGRVRLEQVILNLINNAVDAMAGVDQKVLRVQLMVDEGEAILTVTDSGAGIEDPSRVFEPFYSTKNLGASQGMGMGLALSFGIISRFGGALKCQNVPGGAEFSILLPILEFEKDAA